jgi:hypothetical protein
MRAVARRRLAIRPILQQLRNVAQVRPQSRFVGHRQLG